MKEVFSKKDVESGKAMGILSYIGPLALIPYLVEKNNRFVMFHAKEGMNLFILGVIGYAVVSILAFILFLFGGLLFLLYNAALIYLSVKGIINVCNGKSEGLPYIDKFKFIK